MDLKKIIKEEINGFEWTEGVEPELKTFGVKYMMEMIIEAYDEEEAQGIFENTNLSDVSNELNHDMTTPGIRSTEWYDTISLDEYN